MEFERRTIIDRRKHPTPMLSRYTFWGNRKTFRRKEDQEKGGYVDRYSPKILLIILMIVSLNILDAWFTMIILDNGGWEANPMVGSVIDLYGDHFWVWKFAIVSPNLVLLCLHSKFKQVKNIILGISFVYFSIILYQMLLILNETP